MQVFHHLTALIVASAFCSAAGAAGISKRDNPLTIVDLRIEGSSSTIFEGLIPSRGHVVTTASGGSHECNGLNNDENTKPGATATSALTDAAHKKGFSFDGTFDTEFDDFFITSIGPDTNTDSAFWGILVDFQFTPVGGCQQEVKAGQKVLWAFNAFNVSAFLDLSGPLVVEKGHSVVFTVTDGETGSPIGGADVDGQTTDGNGHVSLTFGQAGTKSFKALKEGTVRSNSLKVLVV